MRVQGYFCTELGRKTLYEITMQNKPYLVINVSSRLMNLTLTTGIVKISVFDSVVQGGDAVWEGLRVYKGKIFKLEEHLDRLVK